MLKNITRITWKKDPEQGEPGATIRPRKFEIGLEYLSGAPGEKFLDYAYYNGVWYRCRETHTPTGDRNPFYDIGHGYTTWSADSGFDFLSTKCLIVGDDGEGWTLENGQIRHTSGKITLDSNGSANFNNKTLIESDGRITAKDGCFYGSFATPPQELTNSTGAVTLSFSSGFNFTGKLTAGSTKTIYLPTDVKYNGVECTIINYGTPSNGRYLIRTSDSSKLLYTSKYDSIDDVSYKL